MKYYISGGSMDGTKAKCYIPGPLQVNLTSPAALLMHLLVGKAAREATESHPDSRKYLVSSTV